MKPALLRIVLVAAFAGGLRAAESPVAEVTKELHPDGSGELHFRVEGKDALVFHFGKEVDLPHFFPVHSPSGQSMTVQKTEPYPHHRSFWFADTVQLAGQRRASFYNGYYTRTETNNPHAPFRDTIRVLPETLTVIPGTNGAVTASWQQVWEMDLGKTPVLDESRTLRLVPLGRGEYLLDGTFTVTAAHGDVTFASDAVHYAWPFIRLNENYNTNHAARLTSSTGATGQTGTNMKVADWVDFSRDDEGLALLSHPSNPRPHAWLTRDYGCLGPRRVEAQSGKPFLLKRGESLSTRCALLVHLGDVQAGKVAGRYADYAAGKL